MSKVAVYKNDGVLEVKINRPEVLNACDGETYSKLAEAWEQLDRDPALRVGILSGEGRAFCVGTDIKWVSSISPKNYVDPLYPRLLTLTKPIIAAIHGHCNGGGLEQALAADIRVCTEDAVFGFGEVKLGWIPGGQGTQRLVRQISLGKALEMLYTGRTIDALEAYRVGLVNYIVPKSRLFETCEEMARDIVSSAPLAVQGMKMAVMEGLDLPLKQAVSLEKKTFETLMETEDAKEGAKAFMEKRLPVWRAR